MRVKFFSLSYIKAVICVAIASICMAGAQADEASPFVSAKPIWVKGLDKEMNVTAGYRVVFKRPSGNKATLRITGHTLYRIYLNGEFVGHGPARGPHDYYRVDEWDLSGKMQKGENLLAVEVAGYNACSFYLINRPSFVQAELLDNRGRVIASTNGDGIPFDAVLPEGRVQKVQRYSYQRPFSEVYRLKPDFDAWMRDPSASIKKEECEEVGEKQYLPRRVDYTRFTKVSPKKIIGMGTLKTNVQPKNFWKDRSLTGIGPQLNGFPESELTCIPSLELQTIVNEKLDDVDIPYVDENVEIQLGACQCSVLDLGTNLSGFLGATVEATQPTRLFFTFDEILTGNDVSFSRLSAVNAIEYDLEPGGFL